MSFEELQQFLSQKGFKSHGKVFYGIVEGYPVTVQQTLKGLGVISYSTVGKFSILAFLTLRKVRLRGCKNGLQFTFKLNKNIEENFRVATEEVVKILKDYSLRPQTECSYCKEENCDSYAYIDLRYQPVHANCVYEQKKNIVNKVEKNQLSGNYATGLLGALIGGIVGTLPNTYTIFQMDKIYIALFLLIPFCVYYGYKLFGGKLDKFSIVLTSIVCIAGIYFIEISLLVMSLMNGYGDTLQQSIKEVMPYLKESYTWEYMTKESAVELLLVLVANFVVWYYLKTNAGKVLEAEEVVNTIEPKSSFDKEQGRENNF